MAPGCRGATNCYLGSYPTGARSEEEEGILAAVVVRARPHVLRVALTYALLDNRQIVDRPHLAAALAVWRYSLDSARWLFRAVNPDLVRLQAFIDEAGPAGRTREQIANDLFAKHLKKDDLDRLLAQLGDGYEQVTVPTKGRPRTVFRPHPAEKAVKAGKATTSVGAAVGSTLSPQRAEKAPTPLDQETAGQGVTPLTPLKPQGAAEDAEAADAAPEPVICSGCGEPLDPANVQAGFTTHGGACDVQTANTANAPNTGRSGGLAVCADDDTATDLGYLGGTDGTKASRRPPCDSADPRHAACWETSDALGGWFIHDAQCMNPEASAGPAKPAAPVSEEPAPACNCGGAPGGGHFPWCPAEARGAA